MSKSQKKRKTPKHVLALPDLEQAKSAVLNSLTSKSGQRTYDHAITEFVEWYCSEPRLTFNRTIVLRYRINLEQRQYAPSTINLRLAAVRRLAYEAADSGLPSPELAARPLQRSCGCDLRFDEILAATEQCLRRLRSIYREFGYSEPSPPRKRVSPQGLVLLKNSS